MGGRCPSCGATWFFGGPPKRCTWCGRGVCNKCMPTWHATVEIKISGDSEPTPHSYEKAGFCSDYCFNQFWQKVLAYPVEYYIGTDIDNFQENWIKLWNDSILVTFKTNPKVDKELVSKAIRAVQIHSKQFTAFPFWDSSGQYTSTAQMYYNKARIALAQNLERCGRALDAAKIFEDLRMYDKARELREKEKHILIRKTDISVNLNALLQQVRDGGIVVVYRCPHCGGTLKISKDTSVETLNFCQHCGSEIKAMDLADFLKTALS